MHVGRYLVINLPRCYSKIGQEGGWGHNSAARGVRDLSGMRQEHVADFLRRERHRRERTSQARRKVSAPTRLFTGFLHYLEERGKWWREAVPPSPILDCFLPFPRG